MKSKRVNMKNSLKNIHNKRCRFKPFGHSRYINAVLVKEGDRIYSAHNDPDYDGGTPSYMPEGYRYGWFIGHGVDLREYWIPQKRLILKNKITYELE